MKIKVHQAYSIITILLIFISIVFIILESFYENIIIVNEKYHYTIEITGAIIFIIIALNIFNREYVSVKKNLIFISFGMLSMGIFRFFHSIVKDDNIFVLLNSLSVLSCSIGFASIWYDDPILRKVEKLSKNFLFISLIIIITASISISIVLICLSDSLLKIISQNFYNYFVLSIYIISSILFAISLIKLFNDFHKTEDLEIFVFICISTLLCISSLMFCFSEIWDYIWWFWHILHLISYLLLLILNLNIVNHTYNELNLLNISLEKKVLERTAQLKEANKELEGFSCSISHDLRNPLTVIKGFSDVLIKNYKDKLDENAMNHILRINKASYRMLNLIEDLMRLSKVKKIEIKLEKISLSEIAKKIVDDLRGSDPERSVDINIFSDMIIEGDSNLFIIALENLINNAWKYTGKIENAKIEFGFKVENNKKIYYVKDNGAGFNSEKIKELFNPFTRLHSQAEFPGTGIGLTIVHQIISKHNGKIWAEGEIDKGAVFYFSFN